ncbi:MAG TPA: hypothetical protein VGD53_04085 [Actinoallomurus sp.]
MQDDTLALRRDLKVGIGFDVERVSPPFHTRMKIFEGGSRSVLELNLGESIDLRVEAFPDVPPIR